MIDRHSAITRSYLIPGQTWSRELAWLYDNLGSSKRHAEIGVFCGRSMFASAGAMSGAIVYAVDMDDYSLAAAPDESWVSDIRQRTMQSIRTVNQGVNVEYFGAGSLNAAREIARRGRRLDSVFIDGAHEYEFISADIQAWMPLVKPGGLICGHDYWPVHAGVMDAVNEFVPDFHVAPETRIWYSIKP